MPSIGGDECAWHDAESYLGSGRGTLSGTRGGGDAPEIDSTRDRLERFSFGSCASVDDSNRCFWLSCENPQVVVDMMETGVSSFLYVCAGARQGDGVVIMVRLH